MLCLAMFNAPTVSAEDIRAKFNKVVTFGDRAPDWKDLPGVDDKRHSLAEYRESKVLVVVFTCNHCPVAKAYERRLIDFAKTYSQRSVQVVAINVNRSRADGLDKMAERAKAKGYTFPYLFDATQASGRNYGATVTPHLFVLDQDRRIAYMGAFDDSMEPENVKRRYLIDAVEALLAGKAPAVRESLQRGCEIQYESRDEGVD